MRRLGKAEVYSKKAKDLKIRHPANRRTDPPDPLKLDINFYSD
jgi:hypothetical protein